MERKPARRKTTAVGRGADRDASPARGPGLRAAPDAPPVEDIRDAVSRLKRERIVATAVELFNHNGFSNTTLEAVAEAMNVTKPFIYSYFASKSELLGEICSRGIRASLDALQKVVSQQSTPTEKLGSMGREFILAVLAYQPHIAIYTREEKHLSPEDREAINALRREFERRSTALLKEGVAAGEFSVDDVNLASLAIGGIVSWACVWYRPSGRLSQAEIADGISALVLQMVGAKTPRRKRSQAAAAVAQAG